MDLTAFFTRNSRAPSTLNTAEKAKNRVLWHLILANILIIALDIALLGIQYGGDHLFYLQGAFKPCLYGIKLKVEFLVLNRLIASLWGSRDTHAKYNSGPSNGSGARVASGGAGFDISISSAKLVSSKARGRSSDLIAAEVDSKRHGEAISMEPLERARFSGEQSYEGRTSVAERPVTRGDGRLFETPIEPWDVTRRH